jgi:hypothetical protein
MFEWKTTNEAAQILIAGLETRQRNWDERGHSSRVKSSGEPAKLADRVVAPGDGAAEPRDQIKNMRSPGGATESGIESKPILLHLSPLRGWVCF